MKSGFTGESRGPGRPSVKKTELLDLFRRKIVDGAYPPGARLPPRSEIMRTHRVSSITVQRTFDQLIRDGFVETHGKAGTRVSGCPPHLHRYGLAFAADPGQAMGWRGLDSALVRAAADMAKAQPHSFPQYFRTADGNGNNEEVRRLISDARARTLRGVISTSGLTPLLEILDRHAPWVPSVVVSVNPSDKRPTVFLDLRSFFTEALDYLCGKNRRRIAVVTGVRYPENILRHLLERDAPARRVTIRPYWVQQVALTDPASLRGVMHLMMNSNQVERPNGLIVADDNLIEHAMAGIAAAGASFPGDIEVVSDANFPSPVTAGLPIQRIGYSGHAILKACLSLLDDQFAKGRARARRQIDVPAIREDRLPGQDVGMERDWKAANK